MVRTAAYRIAELWTQGKSLVRALAFCIFICVRVLDRTLFFTKDFTSPIFSSRAHLAQSIENIMFLLTFPCEQISFLNFFGMLQEFRF